VEPYKKINEVKMQVTVENISKLKRAIKFTIPAVEVDEKTNKKLEQISAKAKLDGFRPGKVPLAVVKQRFGDGARLDVVEEIIKTTYLDTLKKENIKPAGAPVIEPPESVFGQPVAVIMTVEVYPTIKVESLANAKVEKPIATVSEQDIDGMIEKLRKQHGTWEEVTRAAKVGDQVVVDFIGTIKDEAFEGGTGQDLKFEIGAGQMLEDFEKGVTGAKAGKEVEFKLKFPKDYHDAKVAGQKASFTVKINKVLEIKLAEITTEFVEKFGVKSGEIADLRTEIRKGLEQQVQQSMGIRFKENIMDKLLELNKFEIPESLIEDEINHLQHRAKQQLASYTRQKPEEIPDFPRDNFVEAAKRNVSLGLLLQEIIKEQNITADPDKIRAKIEAFAKGHKDPQIMMDWYYQNKQYMPEIESGVLEDQVLAWLETQVKVIEKNMTYDELMSKKK
jgi:trigger factor